MKINKKELFLWELLGAVFISVCGITLHFTYELSNYNFIVGLFSSINESLWESIKPYFFSIVFFSCIEYFSFSSSLSNFFTAKVTSVIFLSAFILFLLNYTQSFLGGTNFLLNIITYVLGCIVAQIISFRILILNKHYALANLISLVFLISLTILFFAFTLNPPNCNLFKSLNKPTFYKFITPEIMA
ncbi:DUF6512 family protein [Clostridium intestinale]|uniref:DUF6512 family protein n=1 Tax=Clostridium intestinale TaxID=36845 RepID=UPI0028E62B03|nr:DUF6512 family protein [Clostridium intestinale]